MVMSDKGSFVDDAHFEAEIRRISRLIWPSSKVERSPMVEGRERDAIVETPDIAIVIEATTSRRKDKIENDAKKTADLVKKIRSQGLTCKGIVVTLHEPTADQEQTAKKYASFLALQSFHQFVSRLFDAPEYLEARLQKYFGSILNPKDPRKNLGREFYIEIPILDEKSSKPYGAKNIAEELRKGAAKFAVLADFGSGKSMALREVFFLLREAYLKREHDRFPLYINLRDHSGAKWPDEILERHARELGLRDHEQLVRAWRGGFVDLLLDGFDEFAAGGWSASPFKLRELRRAMLGAVRRLIRESPSRSGIVVVGRQHYFDSVREMRESLGVDQNFDVLRIEPVSEAVAAQIVKRYGGGNVPDWIPSRALLLSYLAASDILKDAPLPAANTRGQGWNMLIDMICDREAAQHTALDSDSVRKFIERLATLARRTTDGLGSFSEEDLASVFQSACGFVPDDSARLLMSRLPALGAISPESGRRRFIDTDIADAARAGDVGRYISSPYDSELARDFSDALVSLASNGLDRLSYLGEREKLPATQIEVAAEHASRSGLSILTLDITQLLMLWNLAYHRSPLDIRDVQFEQMQFDDDIPDFSKVSFWGCIIESLYISPVSPTNRLPRFNHCLIGSLDGVASVRDLPRDAFQNCEIDQVVDSVARNARILETDLPLGVRVLMTVLNKLFFQAGRGRKENAFVRGLDGRAQGLVPQILALVASQGFAVPTRIRGQTIWLPKRDKMQRVGDILTRPNTSHDALVDRVRNL